MEYFNYFFAVLVIILIAMIARMLVTHGLCGRFFYVDKRKKDVTLHLAIFGTPRKKKDARKVVTSLEECLQHLKKNGYTSATLESHLISQKRMKSVYRIASKYGYSIQNISVFPTPIWQRISIPLLMALLRFKIKFADKSSTKLTFVF